jgi:hypothetical protein
MTEISEKLALCAVLKVEMEAAYSSETMITTTKLHYMVNNNTTKLHYMVNNKIQSMRNLF